jgi:hypothetical protein
MYNLEFLMKNIPKRGCIGKLIVKELEVISSACVGWCCISSFQSTYNKSGIPEREIL